MAELTDEIKEFIVKELAMYQSPQDVADSVLAEFGVKIERTQAYAYDPEGAHGHKLAEKWKVIHASTREAFRAETGQIAIASRAYRLRELETMARRARRDGKHGLAAQLLKQAAEEVGGLYTNRRELTGKGGKDLVPAVPATVIVLPDNGRG